MARVIARDLLRIVAFIPFTSDHLDKVIDRAWWWADEIFVRCHPDQDVDAMKCEMQWAHELALDDIQEAWLECVERTNLEEGDYVAWLFPDEVVVNAQAIKPAIRNNWGKAVGADIVYMHNETQRRTDIGGSVWPFFPFKDEGRIHTFNQRGRGPHYTSELNRVETGAATILSYQLDSRLKRLEWGGVFPVQTSSAPLEKWEGGGNL